ncbi:RNase III [Venustampulla echinocandica]|uniref:Large ribosomal subunit protein mL44 n=1 Tax=Venustampulla echinocandica TaxID=2656787 RepID=A0A370TFU6_9HELO|nr:RNase III [Venustampulla echinocandica]RDL33772.1 RNase III [Venustampulla echinocandica]
MKRLRIERWSGQLLTPRTRTRTIQPCCLRQQQQKLASYTARSYSSSSAAKHPSPDDELVFEDEGEHPELSASDYPSIPSYPSPLPSAALESAKLAALHARLGIPKKLPLQTMARTLVDPSADPHKHFNNASLAQLGGSIMSYHVSEWLLCTYPRLPMTVLFAAQYAYSGPKTLQLVAREWGVETAAAPGEEVDPGLLQFSKLEPGTKYGANREGGTVRPDSRSYYRRGISSRVVYDDEFGDAIPKLKDQNEPLPAELAYSNFVKAVIGAIYLHSGAEPAKTFVKRHILSRHLAMPGLFQFKLPVRELSRLCNREGFEYPVARILSETGRLSRHPVFVVGIYSGKDKLGEGSGPSLQEAKTRACVASLKAWYLYSPGKDVPVPSDMESGKGAGERGWEPVHIDMGEVIH